MNKKYDIDLFSQNSTQGLLSGPAKLAQRWARLFLTELGSVAYRPEVGCDFPAQFYAGELVSEQMVRSSFAISELQIKEQIEDGDTLDESLDTVELLGVSTNENGSLRLSLRLLTMAGSEYVAELPVPYSQSAGLI